VAEAIEAHYLPRYADDAVATTPEGIAVALADRLDTLAACFGIGLKPKGGDPQGLRRAALAVVNTLADNALHADLSELFGLAVDALHQDVGTQSDPAPFDQWTKHRGTGPTAEGRDALIDELTSFTCARFKAQAASRGASADLAEAVLAVTPPDPVLLSGKVHALKALQGHPDLAAILTTFKRVLNITRDQEAASPARSDLAAPAAQDLFDRLEPIEGQVAEAVAASDFAAALELALSLRQPVAQLFDEVLIDDPDPSVKAARVGLLLRVAAVFRQLADFSRITTR